MWGDCFSFCTDSFQNTLAEVWYSDTSVTKTHLNGCLKSKPFKKVFIRSCVSILQSGMISNMLELEEFHATFVNLHTVFNNFLISVPKLKKVMIKGNVISELPKNLFDSFDLDYLDLSSNNIWKIGENIFRNAKLGILNLAVNRLQNINKNCFKNTSIDILYLQENQIVHLYKNTFEGILSVKGIYLSGNHIYHIEEMTFKALASKSALSLDLHMNSLTQINFLKETNLERLDVRYNLISYITLENTTKIASIYTHPNPWNCKCLLDFWKFADAQKIIVDENTNSALTPNIPYCIAEKFDCGKNVNYDEVRDRYFKEVIYDKLTVPYSF